jgi:tetratricopeptide (TPR) repeat protein
VSAQLGDRETRDSPLEIIAGRYELVERLARGGMGEVFRARDRSTGEFVALKRLLASAMSQRGVVAHFMREYHALSALRHPRIIEVYDFGVDQGVQYYTMELLDGQDLRDLSPLPYREACRYLRDVASSLALIHARRLLHRDISPRNVRRTSKGHCKLLDFGALIAFGVPPNITGTPPCIAPEALLGTNLDQRSDLYSLGALAYMVLTGRNAYPVMQLSDLEEAWATPIVRPGRIVSDIPEALDELIVRLMSLDLRIRPNSAAEVIEQLSAIAQLSPDETSDVAVARAFFTSTQLYGRAHALEHLTHHIKQAAAGRGGAVVIEGDLGTGRSRLLSECTLLARTNGLSAVHAAARNQRGTSYAFVQELVATVKQVMPREAEAAGVDEQILWTRAQGSDPAEQRARLQQALTDLFCQIARRRPMLLTIDDVDSADEFSAAFIASLAHEAANAPLLLVVSRTTDTGRSLRPVHGFSARIGISVLARGETASLVSSMFGTGPNTTVLSDWLYNVAGGNPKLTLELADHLLRRGFVRYADGMWSVSSDQSLLLAVPDNLSRTWSLRMESLSPSAVELAELFAVRRRGVTVELCLELAAGAPESTFAALDELVHAGVLESAGDDYVFAHEALRMALRQALSPERLSVLHRRWADVLLAEASQDLEIRLEAGWHLSHTEDELRGADILAEVAPVFVDQMLGLAAAIPALERALEIYERRRRPLEARLRLRSALVLAGYLFDYRLAFRYGEETITLLHEASGLRLAEKAGRYVGVHVAIILGMTYAQLKRLWTPPEHRGPPVYTALRYFVRSIMGMIGVRATSLDPHRVAALFALVKPLAGAPRITSGFVIYLACRALATQMLGREADLKRDLDVALCELRRGRRRDMTEVEYRALLVGLLTADGVNESSREASEALACADRLETLGTHLAQGGALRIRMVYYARRGDSERAEHYRHLIEAHALQGGTVWQGEWFSVPLEAVAGAAWTDLILLRRSLDRLEQLSQTVDGLVHIRDGIRISYHCRRGEYARAAELGELYIKAHPPREMVGWAATYGVIALAWIELGQSGRALQLCEQWLALVSPEDRQYFVMYNPLEVSHATALAVEGDYARAKELMAARTASMRAHREYACLVLHYQYLARMALFVGDRAGYNDALHSMRDVALVSGLPTVVLLADRVAELRSKSRGSPLPPPKPSSAEQLRKRTESPVEAQTAITEFLKRSASSAQRKQAALWFLANYMRCEEAHLFRRRHNGLQLVASVPERAQTLELERALVSYLDLPQNDSVISVPDSSSAEASAVKSFRVMVLRAHDQETGVVAVREGVETVPQVSDGLLADLAQVLAEDVLADVSQTV